MTLFNLTRFERFSRSKCCENNERELISDHPPASIHLGKLAAIIPEATEMSLHLASATQSRENFQGNY